jgi:hypothetical protein
MEFSWGDRLLEDLEVLVKSGHSVTIRQERYWAGRIEVIDRKGGMVRVGTGNDVSTAYRAMERDTVHEED